MQKLKPEVWTRNGRKEFVILTYKEFQDIQRRLDDAEDLLELRRAKKAHRNAPSTSLEEMKRRLASRKRSR